MEQAKKTAFKIYRATGLAWPKSHPLTGHYYVADVTAPLGLYIWKDGSVHDHCSRGWFKTRRQAQDALTKYRSRQRQNKKARRK